MRDGFGTYHPIINFLYFGAMIVCSMFFLHPIFLAISLSAAFLYSVYLNGKRALLFNLGFLLPMMLFLSLINPLFNHRGVTILGYLCDNPITMESIFYGLASGVMFAAIILWFSCYNAIMTSDKFIYLFGRIVPSLSLIFSMVLRFIPKFKAQIRIVANAQKCIGRDIESGTLFVRIKHGLKILSIMMTWMLENAIDTADSMKSRGYGLKGRSAFSLFRFDSRDKWLLSALLLLLFFIVGGVIFSQTTIQYFPMLKMPPVTAFRVAVWAAYFLLCNLPMILNIGEDLKWKRLQSEI